MERRALIAIVLSILVLLLYSSLVTRLYHPKESAREEVRQAPIQIEQLPKPIEKQEDKILGDIYFETKRHLISMSSKSGGITQIQLKDYPDTQTGQPYLLLNVSESKATVLAIPDLDFPDNAPSLYKVVFRGENQILLTSKREGAWEINKRYIFPKDSYGIELELTYQNLSLHPQKVKYNIIGGSGIDLSPGVGGRFAEIALKVGGKLLRKGMRKGEFYYPGDVSWVALKNKYFSLILKPFHPCQGAFSKMVREDEVFTGVEMKEVTLPPNSNFIHQFFLYAGPNDIEQLKAFNLGLEDTVNFGIFGSASLLLLGILKFFFSFLHNWGVAIILLTILISVLLYPLTWKSLKAMKDMKLLQPKIESLRKEYKDDPRKLNKEIMELYRKHRINPLGGCFPILLQMPIFIALYQALVRSIELRGANFLWIKDLSEPDRAPLPFSLPIIGERINILPILMVIFMILQQRISSPGYSSSSGTEQQRMMAVFLPLFFGLIFYNLPSGLVLYWLTNTILTTLYQWGIGKKIS